MAAVRGSVIACWAVLLVAVCAQAVSGRTDCFVCDWVHGDEHESIETVEQRCKDTGRLKTCPSGDICRTTLKCRKNLPPIKYLLKKECIANKASRCQSVNTDGWLELNDQTPSNLLARKCCDANSCNKFHGAELLTTFQGDMFQGYRFCAEGPCPDAECSANVMSAAATCDDFMEFYADGILIGTSDEWRDTSFFNIASSTRVVAIECVDSYIVGGILASFSNGMVTDNSWKCSNSFQSGWNMPGFDDSSWTNAYEIGLNGQASAHWDPERPGISADAYWIWTGAGTWNGGDTHVYCRKNVPEVIQAAVTCDDLTTFYADGVLVGTVGDWFVTGHFDIDAATEVVAIECVDEMIIGGIIGSFGNGLVTDGSWKCSNSVRSGWNLPGYDDSSWTNAYEIVQNDDPAAIWPWTYRADISTSAYWIWTGESTWHGGDTHVYCRRNLACPKIQVAVTCDDQMTLYADGALVGLNDEWRTPSFFDIDSDTQVVAIECLDIMIYGGILASLSNGVVTDSSWKCSNSFEAGWNTAAFDDSHWSSAHEIGPDGIYPWHTPELPGISQCANWIWTASHTWQGGDTHVYCRKTL